MTVERWDDVRLDRLAESLDRLTVSVEQDSQNIRSLLNVVNIHQGNFEVMLGEMRRIGEEVRGLQTENRRILDHLFGDRAE
ncbi:MAG: hypothetical protein HC852_15290 [Acaryochloridaceae cyanobacterium RU_4_10]|nr:hypothetical protein [Acaryochloridaceae cyanobacterium RU_4_10]